MRKLFKALSLITLITVTAATISCDMFLTAPASQLLSGVKLEKPATPENVQVSNATISQLYISWETTINASTYTVSRSTSLDGIYTHIYSGKTTSFTDSDLIESTTYYYIVSASNNAGISDASEPVSGSTAAAQTAPTTPVNLRVINQTATTLEISWAQSTGASTYTLSRSTTSNGTYTPVYSGPSTSYRDSGLTSGTTYFYAIFASNSVNHSSTSSPVEGTTLSNSSQPFSSWNYKKEITITETSGSILTNYQLLITVPYDSNMNSDFSDLRFTADDNETELSYWIERQADSDFADVWIKVPSIPANAATTIIMYYGNASALTSMDGFSTFIFFDDFENGIVDSTKWSTGHSGVSLSESGGSISAFSDSISDFNSVETSDTISFIDRKTVFNWSYTSYDSLAGGIIEVPGGSLQRDNDSTSYRWFDSTPITMQSTSITMAPNNWYRLMFRQNGSNYEIDKDYGIEKINGSNSAFAILISYAKVGWSTSLLNTSNKQINLDYLLIAENAASEPTYIIESSGNAVRASKPE